MQISYDATVDALAIELARDATSAKMKKLTPDVNIDLDAGGRVITIEILNASSYYPEAELLALGASSELLSLAEAASESGLSHTTLRLQLNAGRLVGQKRGRDWAVSRADLLNYLESRAPAGRPAAKQRARPGIPSVY